MNPMFTPDLAAQVAAELRAFLSLCEEALALAAGENQALSGGPAGAPADFSPRRKSLLARLDAALANLKRTRQVWLQIESETRNRCEEVKSLFQAVQGTLMKVLLLDRENQQAMLRRGLIPAQHLPAAAAQRPHFVSGLYQRHAGG